MPTLQEQLEAAVRSLESFMLDTVTISRPTASTDTSGGHTRSYATTITSAKCAIAPARRKDYALIVGEKPIKGTVYAIVLNARDGSSVRDVDTSCKAVVAARDGQSAKTYQVQWVGRASAAALKLLCSTEE